MSLPKLDPAQYAETAAFSLQAHLIHQGGRILFANNQFANQLCWTEDAPLEGQMLGELFGIEPATALLEHVADNKQVVQELRIERRNILPIRVIAQSRKVLWGDQEAYETLLLDITREHNAESTLENAEKLKAIGQLTGRVAHDINNMWGVIGGNLELLESKLSTRSDFADLERYFTSSTAALGRGVAVTREILAYVRRPRGEAGPVDLADAVNNIRGLLDRATGNSVELSIRIEPGLGEPVLDVGELEQALLNMALNAGDAMPEGGKFTIEAHRRDLDDDAAEQTGLTAGPWLILSVSDTGSGMSEAVAQHASEPFVSTKEDGSGSGLGLTQVRDFIYRLGGHVTLRSRPDQGTAFLLYLPLSKTTDHLAENTAAVAVEEAIATGPADADQPSRSSILLVETDRSSRLLAAMTLQRQGHQVTEVTSLENAKAALETATNLDVLMTDISVEASGDGLTLAEATRQRFPDCSLILVGGPSDDEEHRKAGTQLATALLRKPFHRQDLAQALRIVFR
jgi:signal transduction histidine kinase/CheY-like chemotaxis protein